LDEDATTANRELKNAQDELDDLEEEIEEKMLEKESYLTAYYTVRRKLGMPYLEEQVQKVQDDLKLLFKQHPESKEIFQIFLSEQYLAEDGLEELKELRQKLSFEQYEKIKEAVYLKKEIPFSNFLDDELIFTYFDGQLKQE
jgi:hypothetical protein